MALLACAITALAGEVEISRVELVMEKKDWRVSVTLRHEDTGWDHYADAWRVVTQSGDVLGTRVLAHPHVEEQPFTRSLDGIVIPDNVSILRVEAHDKVHGWTREPVRVDLERARGDRYSVRRPANGPAGHP
jgi:hypothetical protein